MVKVPNHFWIKSQGRFRGKPKIPCHSNIHTVESKKLLFLLKNKFFVQIRKMQKSLCNIINNVNKMKKSRHLLCNFSLLLIFREFFCTRKMFKTKKNIFLKWEKRVLIFLCSKHNTRHDIEIEYHHYKPPNLMDCVSFV